MIVTVVFDGASLPSKRETEEERYRARAEALAKAREEESKGNKSLSDSLYARSVDVTPEMAHQVCLVLRGLGVNVIVAPYEADAQLGYLNRHNIVDFVISEDSDLLVYGCSRVLYKLDFKTELGREVRSEHIFRCCGFDRLSEDTFLVACVLAGCDYLDSLASIGIKKALVIASKAEGLKRSNSSSFTAITSDSFLDRLIMLVKLSGVDEFLIDENFKEKIRQAFLTFRHQTIFCPLSKLLIPLNPTDVVYSFCGGFYDSELACRVASCEVHPETKQVFSLPACTVASSEPKKPPKSKENMSKRLKCIPLKEKNKTLLDCWKYTVPFSADAKSSFSNPVIELVDDSPPRNADPPEGLHSIEAFRSESYRNESPDETDVTIKIEKFRFNS